MPGKQSQTALNHRRKNRHKGIRSALQFGILAFLAYVIVHAVFFIKSYESSALETSNHEGFIALSYFGVDRNGNTKYISKSELEKQLTVLNEQGFQTISQDQILDYYENGTPLPEKALFLSFEDGRNDSAIFAQKSLEELNYKATMFTYADKMDTEDPKFLKPDHLSAMIRSGYWELGSNGYRLSYINAFGPDGNYLGELDEAEISDKTKMEYYNHYLMDFLKDEFLIPKESYEEMKDRIRVDYGKMQDIYTAEFGFMPNAYAIMHANSLHNNMNPLVAQVNDTEISNRFSLHFNRDRQAFNGKDGNLMDLNRLQVAPYWPVNHLLMKVHSDSGMPVTFIEGDEETAGKWRISNGAAEYKEGQIILTSYPGEEVTATLEERIPSGSEVRVDLNGNVMGRQSVILQGAGEQAIILSLEKNRLDLIRRQEGEEQVLSTYPLEEISWDNEDYAFNKATDYTYMDTQNGSRIDREDYPSNLKNDRSMKLSLGHEFLRVEMDGLDGLTVDLAGFDFKKGYRISMAGSGIDRTTSHERYENPIYDAIFTDLLITGEKGIIYSGIPTKRERLQREMNEKLNEVVDFFIETF